MKEVVVLWEDSAAKGTKVTNYGPHLLLLRCLVDRRETFGGPYELGRRVTANPRSGIDKLLLFAKQLNAEHIVAVCDDDKIRAHLSLAKTATDDEVIKALQTKSPRTHWVLLHRNMEDVVSAASHALGKSAPTTKLSPDERDQVLQRLANSTADTRARFLRELPSFEKIVNEVERILVSP